MYFEKYRQLFISWSKSCGKLANGKIGLFFKTKYPTTPQGQLRIYLWQFVCKHKTRKNCISSSSAFSVHEQVYLYISCNSYRDVSLLKVRTEVRKSDTEQQEIKVIYVDTDIFIGEKTKTVSASRWRRMFFLIADLIYEEYFRKQIINYRIC